MEQFHPLEGVGIDAQTLAAALTVLRAPLPEILPRVSEVLADLVPHQAVAMLTGDCSRSPLVAHGEPAVTSTEMVRLAGAVDIGTPWFGSVVLGGVARPVLAVATAPKGSAGSLLAVIDAEDTPGVRPVVQQLWDLTIVHVTDLLSEAEPVYLAESRAAAGARARTVAELTDTHAATLTALLGALRSRTLDESAARRTATDIAVSALIELRTAGDDDRAGGAETAGEAFAEIADKLSLIARYGDVALEFAAPEQRHRVLPGGVAHAGRATVRGAVLTLLDQGGVTRIRVAWDVDDTALRITVRDDGDGILAPDALAVHRLGERLATLNGTLAVEAVPGWGTTITARVPLAPPTVPDPGPLTSLNPRELEVLGELTRGHRNRDIADHLSISEHTVKFHVANILTKLGVRSRGEAAAAARDAGL